MAETKQEQLEQVQSEKFVSVYSNNATIEVTPWDVRFVFGELTKTNEGKVTKIERLVSVTMSPQHAKALLGVLQTNLVEYEKQIGEIKLPKPEPPKDVPNTAKSN